MKDVFSGKVTVIYNAKEAISGLKTPIVNDPKVIKFQKYNSIIRLRSATSQCQYAMLWTLAFS